MEQQQKAPKEVREIVNFLRSSKAGMKTRVGVLNGKRVDYFKGKSAVKAVLSPNYAKLKNAPKVTNEVEAVTLLNSIIPFAFYLRVDRGQAQSSGHPKQLTINPMQQFKQDDLFAWFYEGPMWTTYLGGLAMVAVLLAGVMFPLWPPTLRLGVWYLSIGVLGLIGLFIVIAILRLIFYIITVVVAPPGIWVFPQLFADVGVIESFIPFWEWDLPKKKKSRKLREEGSSKKEKGKGKATDSSLQPPGSENGGGAHIEEVDTSGDSRPGSRAARVEDAQEDE
ncbi:SEC62 [Sanghuangporus weigelae]